MFTAQGFELTAHHSRHAELMAQAREARLAREVRRAKIARRDPAAPGSLWSLWRRLLLRTDRSARSTTRGTMRAWAPHR